VKQMTIPSVRVSTFTVANVECVVMPEEKGDIDPLLESIRKATPPYFSHT